MFLPGLGAAGAERPMKIYVLGDSLTAGYGVSEQDSFPGQLQAALGARGHAVEVLNGGVSGDTTAGGLARLGWALKDEPDAVIVALGGNDALRGIDPRSMKRNLDAILRRLAENNIPALIAGFKAPRNLGDDYATFDIALIDDTGKPLADITGFTVSKLNEINIGKDVKAQLTNDQAGEASAIAAYNAAIKLCVESADNGTRSANSSR